MKLIPSKKQWNNWSLPSKASYASAIFGVFAFICSILMQVVSLEKIYSYIGISNSRQDSSLNIDWSNTNEDIAIEFYSKAEKLPSFVNGIHVFPRIIDWAKSECGDSFNDTIYKILLLRNIVAQIERSDWERYGMDYDIKVLEEDIKSYRPYQKSLIFYTVNNRQDLLKELSGVIEIFHFYRMQFEKNDSKILDLAYNTLTQDSNDVHKLTEDEKFHLSLDVLEYSGHDNYCIREYIFEGEITIEEWVMSFWLRRWGEGNYHMYSQALDMVINLEL